MLRHSRTELSSHKIPVYPITDMRIPCWPLALLCLVTFTDPVTADTLQGRVVGVADGDTVTVLDSTNTQTKIRLMGIDAPEKKQPFGQRSKASLSDLIYDKQVTVEYNKTDRYGRTIGKILLDGLDVNLQQIKNGLAWHYKKYEREQPVVDRDLYADAEREAMDKGLGLWHDATPIPPWEWRHRK